MDANINKVIQNYNHVRSLPKIGKKHTHSLFLVESVLFGNHTTSSSYINEYDDTTSKHISEDEKDKLTEY